MKESLFKYVEITTGALWVVSLALYGLYMEGNPIPPKLVVYGIALMFASAPIYAGMVIFRWDTKWPRGVHWLEIGFALGAMASALMAARTLLDIFADSPLIFMKVILPTLIVVTSAFAGTAAIAWYKDRERQQSAH